MQFHYDKTLKQNVKAMTQIAEETPAWLTICLAKSLKEWLGQSCRVSHPDGQTQLQLGYEVLSAPVPEFAETFAPLVCNVDSIWPVQIFGMADNRELIELCGICFWKSIWSRLNLNGSGTHCCKMAPQTGSSGIWLFTALWNNWASDFSAAEVSLSLWTARGNASISAWTTPMPQNMC